MVVNGQCSDWTDVKSGTPEGGLLSPLMFSMYINDLPLEISKSKILMFADDVKLYKRIGSSSDIYHLQEDLDRLSRWSERWKLALNPAKCKHFRMTLRTKPVNGTMKINGTCLDYVSEIRDLGVILDQKLTFGPHMDGCVKKANRALGLLIRSFQKTGRRNGLNLSAVLVSYYAHVRSILEYSSVVWAGAAKTHLSRIERIQHKFLLWLDNHSMTTSRTRNYANLLKKYNVTSLSSRQHQHDLLFLRNLFRGRIDAPDLLGRFSLSAPKRIGRYLQLFNVPFGRVSSVKNGLVIRLPRAVNEFIVKCPAVDVFHDTLHSYKTAVVNYVKSMTVGET